MVIHWWLPGVPSHTGRSTSILRYLSWDPEGSRPPSRGVGTPKWPIFGPILGPPKPQYPVLRPLNLFQKGSQKWPIFGDFGVPTPIPMGSDPRGVRPPARSGYPKNGSFLGPLFGPLFSAPTQKWVGSPLKYYGTGPDPSKKGSKNGSILGTPKNPVRERYS